MLSLRLAWAGCGVQLQGSLAPLRREDSGGLVALGLGVGAYERGPEREDLAHVKQLYCGPRD